MYKLKCTAQETHETGGSGVSMALGGKRNKKETRKKLAARRLGRQCCPLLPQQWERCVKHAAESSDHHLPATSPWMGVCS